jgi:hypothetical protein
LRYILLYIFLTPFLHVSAQVQASIATDMTVLRNFSPKQKFWAIGQTITGNFHFSKKETIYTWLTYYSPGRFRNNFTATAKSPATTPQTYTYRVTGTWRFRAISVGWKHYIKGAFNEENTWSLYSLAGFGLMFNKAENRFHNPVDTALYQPEAAPVEGKDVFRRLTFDLGLGVDIPIGADIYLYTEGKTFAPTSGYPSPLLHENKNVPLSFMLNVGIRILFGSSY